MVLAGFDPNSRTFTSADYVAQVLSQEKAGITRKEAINEVAKALGVPKRDVFDAMVEHKTSSR